MPSCGMNDNDMTSRDQPPARAARTLRMRGGTFSTYNAANLVNIYISAR